MKRVLLPILAGMAVAACGPTATQQANELTAIGTLRQINNAQLAYSTQCGDGGYAVTFKALTAPNTADATPYLDAAFAGGGPIVIRGYRYRIAETSDGAAGPSDCHGGATSRQYYLTAEPVDAASGTRAFATDAYQTVWEQSGLRPPARPFAAPARPVS
jgi:hypothetical protein